MIQELFPYMDFQAGHWQTDQCSGLYSVFYNIFREKRDPGPLFHQGADQFCASDLQDRLDFQGKFR